MLVFLGLIINMGVIRLPYVKDYWSQQFVCRVPFFGEVFTRKHFLQIFWMLHLETVSTSDHSLRTRTQKVSNFLKYMDARFREYFIPGQNLSVDESVVGFKGKIYSSLTTQKKKQLNGESVSMFWQTLPPAMSAPSFPTMAKSPQRASSNQIFLLHPKLFFNFSIISDRHGLTLAVTTFVLTDFIQAQHLPVN